MSERVDQFVKTATAQSELEKKALGILKPFIVPALSFALLLYIYLWVLGKYGIDRVVISLLLIIILELRGIEKVLSHGRRAD